MINCTQAIEYYKKEIMKLLGMKEWGVLDLINIDDEIVSKVYDLMDKIDELNYAKYKLDRMREEIQEIQANVRELYK